MKKQHLILEINDFISNYTKENTENIIPSNTLYNYFCFLYQKNTKEFTIQTFLYYFLLSYTKIHDKKLNRKILKQNNTTIRCLEDIEIIPCKNINSLLNLNKEVLKDKALTSTLRSTVILHTTVEPGTTIINKPKELSNIESTTRLTPEVDQTKETKIKPNFNFMNDWLINHCAYDKNSTKETPIHLLKENYSKLYLNNINIDNTNNRTFVGNIEKLGNIIWPGSNLKKEDRKRKQNTAFIKGLIIKK